jgi:hypothetical protein
MCLHASFISTILLDNENDYIFFSNRIVYITKVEEKKLW